MARVRGLGWALVVRAVEVLEDGDDLVGLGLARVAAPLRVLGVGEQIAHQLVDVVGGFGQVGGHV